MVYIDGFLLTVPENRLADYKRMASKAAKIWKKHGALSYVEAVGDDLHHDWCKFPFDKAAKAKPGELVVFSYIVYKSRAHRDKVNAAVMKDPGLECPEKDMPFDMKRMAFGGFKSLVDF